MAVEKRTINSDDEGSSAAPQITAVPSRPPLKKRLLSGINIQQRGINKPTQPTTPTTPTTTKQTESQQQQQQQQQPPPPPPPPSSSFTQQTNASITTTIATASSTTATSTSTSAATTQTPPLSTQPTVQPTAQSSAQPSAIRSTPPSAPAQQKIPENPQEIESSSNKTDAIINETQIDFDTDSKPILLKEMREAKEKVLFNEKKLESLEAYCLNQETKQSLYKIQLKMIQVQVGFMTNEHDFEFFSTHQISLDHQKSFQDSCMKAIHALIDWHHRINKIEKDYQRETDPVIKRNMLVDFVKNEVNDLSRAYHRNERFLDDMRKRLESVRGETRGLMNTVHYRQSELKSVKEKLKEITTEYRLNAKKRDRSQSKLVNALQYGGLGDIEPMEVDAVEEVQENEIPENKDENQQSELVTERDSKNKLSELNLILTAREKEIDLLKRDRQSLVHEEERLMDMFSKLSEESLLKTDYLQSLQLSIEHYRDRCQDLEQIRNTVKREVDKLLDTQRQIEEQIRTEKASQAIAMEAETKKLEGDLLRIRAQRQNFQQLVEEQKLNEVKQKEEQEMITSFAEERKSRITSLQKSIEELKNEQEMSNSSLSEEYNTYLRLRNDLNELKITLSSLECIEKNTIINPSQLATLEHHLKKWKSNSYVIALDDELKESQKLTSLIDFYEMNESKLLEEIDRVGAIYTKLEEQESKRIFDSGQRSDQILKLQAEKLKYAQTFGNLITQKDQQASTNVNLRVTREKQQDLIKQLEDKEKSLESQVNEKESQVRDVKRKIEENKTDLEDMSYYCTDLRNSLDYSQNVINELQKTLKDKSKLLDEETQLGNEIEENHRKMKKKWESISQGNNPAKDQLEKECNDLMAMLKCSTCRTRFRTNILIRCMHTFCKPCIEARLETRQRRCPTCSESFGASDVKVFHL